MVVNSCGLHSVSINISIIVVDSEHQPTNSRAKHNPVLSPACVYEYAPLEAAVSVPTHRLGTTRDSVLLASHRVESSCSL
jgi:hypothetical protein